MSVIGTSVYMVVFRVLHILSAIAWAGSVFLFVTFIQPSAATTGPAGAPFMAELLGRRRLVDRVIAMGSVTVAAGLFLYWHDADLYGGIADFASTTFGTWLTIGAVAAISALLIGILGIRPRVERLLRIGGEAAAAGGPPPEQAAEMGSLQSGLRALARTALALIAVAAFSMATARYW